MAEVVRVIIGQKRLITLTVREIEHHILQPILIQVRVSCVLYLALAIISNSIFFVLGGLPGPSGSRGSSPTQPLYDGLSGKNGNFRFLIEDR